jgi:dTDP-4-dehydrorhamnose 3,5-epimerase
MNEFSNNKELDGVWQRKTNCFADERGYFGEVFRQGDLPHNTPAFVQISVSSSKKGVLRGMHAQVNQWQLVTLLEGSIHDVVLDINPASKTFGRSTSIQLTSKRFNQILLKPGIAHGYYVESQSALILYGSTMYYEESPQIGISWDSNELISQWPKKDVIISKRDSEFNKFLNHPQLELFSTFK